MKLFKNFAIKMVKMNFILWKIATNIILIENTMFFLFGVCIYITYQIKNCVYIIKKRVYICVCGIGLINVLVL